MKTFGRRIKREVPRERVPLVLMLELVAGESVVTVREKKRRKGYSITVPKLFVVLAEREASNKRARRRGRHRGLATEGRSR